MHRHPREGGKAAIPQFDIRINLLWRLNRNQPLNSKVGLISKTDSKKPCHLTDRALMLQVNKCKSGFTFNSSLASLLLGINQAGASVKLTLHEPGKTLATVAWSAAKKPQVQLFTGLPK